MIDIKLYTQLLAIDRAMIDEYTPKMQANEINSFMQRIISFYAIENKSNDTLIVNEDIDSVLVFEKNNYLGKARIPFNVIFTKMEQWFVKTNNTSKLNFYKAIKQYFDVASAMGDDWIYVSDINNIIHKNYVQLASNDCIKQINGLLPARFYTYRINKVHNEYTYKTRLGVVIDSKLLPQTKHSKGGFGPNFIMDKHLLSVQNDGIDISAHVKPAVYWTSKNSNIHGFGNRTGIMWFDGAEFNGKWQLPNGIIIQNDDLLLIQAFITDDAFAKMQQRFNINKKLCELI